MIGAAAETPAGATTFDAALHAIAATARDRDRAPVPVFPENAIVQLEAAGALALERGRGSG